MKFLFIYPGINNLELGPKKYLPVGAHVPPIGVLYLAKILELNGYKVEVLDLNAEKFDYIKIKRKIISSDIIGLTLYSGNRSLNNSLMLAKLIKEIDSDIPILIGGPHCSYFPQQALTDHKADVCVKGEGEQVILPIVEAIIGKKSFSTIPGIYYKNGNSIKKNKESKQIKDLDSLPFPARHLVEKYDYGYILGSKISYGKTTSILTSRGCPYKCRFCGLNYIVPGYRVRSFENIKNELEEIIDSGYKTLVFVDDNFLQNKNQVEKIMDFIIQKNAKIHIWIEQARVDSADEKLYQKMKDAGTEIIDFGLESGCQEILDYYDKKITLSQIRNAIDLSKKMGFYAIGSFIIGAPVETKEQIEITKKFAKSLRLDAAYFFNFLYMIGSPLWQEAVKENKIKSDEYFIVPDKNKGLGNFTEKELIDYVNKVYFSYYFNPNLWFREIFYAFSKKDFRFLKLGLKILSPF
ncbi:MAG: B12-binding domain-containing radical SAM protein [Thermoplasmatota archaeon]|jgi:radical SAM superfamily enzyme YgiQ (UPF0313 family)